jgi:hypothetical protein
MGQMAYLRNPERGRGVAEDMDTYPPTTTIHLELGSVRQPYNSARILGDTGTKFSLRDLMGEGGFGYGRITVLHNLNANQGIRVMLAPLRYSGTGQFTAPVRFQDATFSASTPTTGSYMFNSYRVSYWSTVRQSERELWRIGGTLKVRDARIALRQGSTYRESYNLGVVPLVYLSGERKLSERWRLLVDADGLAAPQGRAFDIGLFLAHRLAPKTDLTLGVRTLEGGADNDRVYNFARLDYLSVGWLQRL